MSTSTRGSSGKQRAICEKLENRWLLSTTIASEAGPASQIHIVEAASVVAPPTVAAKQSAAASITYLDRAMDQFNNAFPVYQNVSSAGNHFFALAYIPDASAPVSANGSWTDHPHSGATALRFVFSQPGESFGGVDFLNGILQNGDTAPELNFGEVHDAGINLTGATSLTFWARGQKSGEQIEFLMGGAGYQGGTGAPLTGYEPDSTRTVSISVRLTTQWRQYTINLSRVDLSYVLNGFGWVASAANNPNGAVFFVDDIQYNLNAKAKQLRLNQPRFIKSYATLPVQSQPAPVLDFDLRFRQAAFTYDNALAILAFLADGSADSLRRARLIGDAFVYAANHDRTFQDGSLRSVYSAGDISLPAGWNANGRPGTAPAPGFYVEGSQKFEDLWAQGDDPSALDVGNNAWVMIALEALYQKTAVSSYLSEAQRLGAFIERFRQNTGTYQGFLGGIANPESASPSPRTYASTEHNLDAYAAFTKMYSITGDLRWRNDATHAQQFVASMWDASINSYRSGTLNPSTRNQLAGQLPLDVQAWSALSIPGVLSSHPMVLSSASHYHAVVDDGLAGYDFNDDRDGMWLEGTGQMAVAYAFAGQAATAESIRAVLRRAQHMSLTSDGFGLTATVNPALTTGFNFEYFRRLHIGATAWNVFAQLGFNPFYGD